MSFIGQKPHIVVSHTDMAMVGSFKFFKVVLGIFKCDEVIRGF